MSSRRATRRTPVLCKAPCDYLNSEALCSSNRVASTLHQYIQIYYNLEIQSSSIYFIG